MSEPNEPSLSDADERRRRQEVLRNLAQRELGALSGLLTSDAAGAFAIFRAAFAAGRAGSFPWAPSWWSC